MNNPRAKSGDSEGIGLEAAGWLIKRDRGFSPGEQDAFFQWLAADPRHGEWFSRHRRTWKEFNLLAEWRPEHSVEPNPDLLARPRRTGHWLAWTGVLAAAANVAIAVYVWSPWKQERTFAPAVTVAESAQAYQRRTLEDGSTIELNGGARVEIAYTASERRVRLVRGEAGFSVARNPLRPFIVRAGGVDVRAVGTVFNVRLDSRSVEVLVSEGKVGVVDAERGDSLLEAPATGGAPLLVAGQRVVVEAVRGAPVPPAQVTSDEMARLLAWRPHMLEFNPKPLGEVVAEFNRCNRTQLILEDPSLASLPIVASFRSDNVEGFVRLLEMTTDVRAERRGDGEVVLGKIH